MTVKLELTEDEAEWLAACLGLVMHLARKWDDRTADDLANRTFAKLSLARMEAGVGMSADEWLASRKRAERLMKVGIVGSEAAKFTSATEEAARESIRALIKDATLVISGHSPLGGIDWWAIEEAKALGIETLEHPAVVHQWESVKGADGFKARNLKIARDCDTIACITVKRLPPGYRGRVFPSGCYHCGTPPDHHVKSGGCWTMREAIRLGKSAMLVVIK